MIRFIAWLSFIMVAVLSRPMIASEPLRALIIDGQNNHGAWPKTTFMIKKYLEESGLFVVDIARTRFTWQGDDLLKQFPFSDGIERKALKEPMADPDFKPEFERYDVVISNFGFGAADWPEETQKGLERFVAGGGGLVVLHAADNSFGDWPQYNRMIGIGGWGGRTEKNGPYVYLDSQGKTIRDTSSGNGGSHGSQHEFEVILRDTEHPITKGLPKQWLHAQDELYDRLRGPAENMRILATAFSSTGQGGTDRHEPMIMTIDYEQGRVFHTPMGHADYSMECVGFITILLRGTEWAATGRVTNTAVPADFPSAEKSSRRKFD